MAFSPRAVWKMLVFNAGLLVVNIVLFSKALVGLRLFGGSALESAAAFTILAVSGYLFFKTNFYLLTNKVKKIDPKQTVEKITDLASCHSVLSHMEYSGTFSGKIEEIKEQILQMLKKKDLIDDILLQKFNSGEMSYQKFKAIVDNTEKIMCANIKSIINRISAFDDDEYEELKAGKSRFNREITRQKIMICNQYIEFVEQAVSANDEVLIRLDKLIFELSKLNSMDVGELEGMQALKDLDSLISDTKWYK